MNPADLEALVPPPPPVAGWAATARARARTARRRRTTALLAAGALLVAATATAGLSGSERPDGQPARAPYGLDRGCPPTDTPIPYPDDGVLARGATSVRLCNASGDLSYTGHGQRVEDDFQVPVDQLTTDVDAVVDVVDALAEPTTDSCGGVGGATHVYWFAYPDGTTRAVSWLYGGCADVTVRPGDRRVGGSDLHEAFAEALLRQRATSIPPRLTAEPSCDPAVQPLSQVVTGETLDLVTAIACTSSGSGRRSVREAPLTADQTRQLDRAYAPRAVSLADVGRGPSCGRQVTVRGYTAWGDLIELTDQCGRVIGLPRLPRYPLADEKKIVVWDEPKAVVDLLQGLSFGPAQPLAPYPPEAYSTSTAPAAD